MREASRKRYAANREERRAYLNDWKRKKLAADPEYADTLRGYVQKYRDANREKVNEQSKLAMRAYRSTPEGAESNRQSCHDYRFGDHRNDVLAAQREKHFANRDENNAKRAVHYYDHREENRPVRATKLHQARKLSTARFSLKGAQERATKKGVPFNLTREYLESIWTGRCAITDFPLSVGKGTGPKFFSPSLDRIVPALGYVEGNVRFVLWAINAFKGEATDNDVYAVACAIVASRKFPLKSVA